MKNKILLVGLFCCSLVSTEAQVLLDKNAGKNSFPIVSPAANVVVCFDGKDETVVRKSVTLFADDVRRVTGQDRKKRMDQCAGSQKEDRHNSHHRWMGTLYDRNG